VPFSKADMLRLFQQLNAELASGKVSGEIYLVGGAVMCLVHEARLSTRDLDGVFRPVRAIREAAQRVAAANNLADDWLNDAVKRYLSTEGDFVPFVSLSNLQVLTATPEYLLAMKCLAMRLGAEFHDQDDARFLLRYLNITRYQTALDIISRYYPIDRIPQKTLYALEELLPDSDLSSSR